jgi:hypothetical protein
MALRDRIPFLGGDPAIADPGQSQDMLGHTPAEPTPEQMPRPRVGIAPLGQSGRANMWGLPQSDELNRELIGSHGLRRFNEMYRTDPHVRRLVLAAWSPIVAGTWTLEPYGGDETTAQDKEIADTIWWLLNEYMSPNFTSHLYEVGPLLLRSGFLPFEQIWGTVKYGGRTLLAPRKLDLRLPVSVWRWWQDDFGDLTHIGQIVPTKADVVIPATELVYYRLGAEGDNWQGTSLLRHAYKPWYLKDRLERIDSIGQERKAVGVPVVYPPTSASPQQKSDLEQLLMSLHTSEVAYLMMPGPKAGSQGSNGVPQEEWLLDIIKFDSSSGEGIMNSIAYHQQGISASFLTDFLELGHHQVGARATAEVQEDPFLTAVNGALLPPIVPPLNALIDRIRRLNFSDAEGSPTLKLTLHDEASLSEIAAYVVPLIQAQAIQVDPELEDYLRSRGGLPGADPTIRAQKLKAQQAGYDQAGQLAETGEEPGSEPPDPDRPPGDSNPIAGAVEKTGQAPRGGNAPTGKSQEKAPTSLDTLVATDRLMALEQATGHESAILALLPDEPFKGVDEPAREQHLTLAHLGRASELSDEQHQTIAHIAHAHAATMPPVAAEVSGTSEIGDGAHVALISAPGLGEHRAALVNHLKKAGIPVSSDYDFLPHVTYSYEDGANPPARGHSVRFSRLVVWRGEKRQRVALSGEQGKQLDAPAPASSGTGSSSGLQMVPEIQGHAKLCRCEPPGPFKDGRCVNCDGVEPKATTHLDVAQDNDAYREGVADRQRGRSKQSAAAFAASHPDADPDDYPLYEAGYAADRDDLKLTPTQLAATAEPTEKWFERLLSKQQLAQAFDGCREHIEAACQPQVLDAARKLAHQVANGVPVTDAQAPPELADALTKHYEDLYQLGHATVRSELERQRQALGKTLDDPVDAAGGDLAASRLARARQRGEHSARNIASKISERLGRDQITGLRDASALQLRAEQAATAQLRSEALTNTAPMINDGRGDAASSANDVAGGIYTSCMDERSCDACIAADTGDILPVADAMALGPPNPDCEGGDFCRCLILWVLSGDAAALQGIS